MKGGMGAQGKEIKRTTIGPRERRLALMAAIIVACWGFFAGIVQPMLDRLHEIRRHTETHTEKLQALDRLVRNTSLIEQRYNTYAGYLESVDDEHTQGSFLDELEALSTKSNVQINFKPRPGKQEDRISRFEVELDVEGSQQHVMAFLDELFRMAKLIEIERVRIAAVPMKADTLRANILLQKLTIEIPRSGISARAGSKSRVAS